LVRAWRDAGHEVTYVQNVTDVDDPLLERADRDGEDWRELADREIARYRGDMEALRVVPPAPLVGAVGSAPLIEPIDPIPADRDGEDWRELADREIARYRGDMEALRVVPPAQLVGAVEALPLIDRMNQILADRGALYEVDSDVYFSRATDPEFGAVSHLGLAD